MSNAPEEAGGWAIFTFCYIMLSVLLAIWMAWNPDELIEGYRRASDYWPVVVAVLRFELYLAAVIFAVALLLCGLAVGWALLSRRTPLIFVSYYHSNYDELLELVTALRRANLEPIHVPFSSDYQHDGLLDKIYDGISSADFFICLPGLEPSFVEAEISAAIMSTKPVFIILPEHHRGAPDTSHKSYPVLVLERLQSEGYNSLATLLKYLHGDWRSTGKLLFDFRNFTAPQIKVGLYLFGPLLLISGFVLLFGDVIINILSFVAVVGGGGASGMGMVTGTEPFLVIIAFVGFPSLLLGFAVFAVLGGIWARWRSRLIVRRKIERGTYSFQSLTKLLGTSDFLTAFWTVSPKAHHEMSSPSDVA